MQIGFIGLGNMGQPLAGFLIKAGLPLVVHDIRAEAARPLLEQGPRGLTLPGTWQRGYLSVRGCRSPTA